jgi:hypothetical protein
MIRTRDHQVVVCMRAMLRTSNYYARIAICCVEQIDFICFDVKFFEFKIRLNEVSR